MRDYQGDHHGAVAPARPTPAQQAPNTAEQRQKSAAKHLKRTLVVKTILGLLILAAIVVAVFITWRHFNRPPNPIPTDVQQSLGFPVYYPAKLANAFSVDQNSIEVNGNLLFYVITDGNEKIAVVEQSLPANLPQPNFKVLSSFETAAGPASTGTSNGSPVAILKTPKTLINVSAPKQTPANTFYDIIKSMTH
jgi:hypothetical protein